MTHYQNVFGGGPNGSLGKAVADVYQSSQQRNSLIPGTASPSSPAQPLQEAHPSVPAAWLANTIGHAAVLSDTPDKWEQTVAMLRKTGINPEGYEDFQKGRAAAMAATGFLPPQNETEPDPNDRH
jgi:hypothetical protein